MRTRLQRTFVSQIQLELVRLSSSTTQRIFKFVSRVVNNWHARYLKFGHHRARVEPRGRGTERDYWPADFYHRCVLHDCLVGTPPVIEGDVHAESWDLVKYGTTKQGVKRTGSDYIRRGGILPKSSSALGGGKSSTRGLRRTVPLVVPPGPADASS